MILGIMIILHNIQSRCEKIEKHRVMKCIEETCRKSIKKSTNK